MSLIIKGMKMPNTCEECEFASWSNLCQTMWCNRIEEPTGEDYSKDYKVKRADYCPLVELPPHGRLIDADALIHEYYKNPSYPNLCKALNNAPTIIESEGVKE